MRKKATLSSSQSSSAASPRASRSRTVSAPSAARLDSDASGLLVLVELGAEWPNLPAPSDSSRRRVLAQVEGETPDLFGERVANGLDSLFGRGIQLASVALACNERLDEAAEQARRKILSLALGMMAKHRTGRAYLTAPPRSSGRLRHALSALAHGLFEEWRTAGLEVSVEFGEAKSDTARATPFAFTARVA